MKIMLTVLHKGLKISVIIGIIAIVVGLFLPNYPALREKARRVQDLENLNTIWKAISSWGLTPSTSGIPLSLDQLVKNKIITPDMLINHETGKPIEYYPCPYSNGNDVVLVSRGKHGMSVIKVAGQGMWVDDGTPHDADSAGDRWNRWMIIGIGLVGLVTVLLAGLCWILGRLKAKSESHLA